MPLTMAEVGKLMYIKKIGGRDETKRHLENLGFTVGGMVSIVSRLEGNLIVKVKEARVAIGMDLANKIIV